MVRATFQPGCKRRIADKHTSWLWCKALQCALFCRTDAGRDCHDAYWIDAIKLEAAPRYHFSEKQH